MLRGLPYETDENCELVFSNKHLPDNMVICDIKSQLEVVVTELTVNVTDYKPVEIVW